MVVLLAAPLMSACPEVKAFYGARLGVGKVRMNELRFSRHADSISGVCDMGSAAFGTRPAITGHELERIDKRVGS